jgi:hypothetical protein
MPIIPNGVRLPTIRDGLIRIGDTTDDNGSRNDKNNGQDSIHQAIHCIRLLHQAPQCGARLAGWLEERRSSRLGKTLPPFAWAVNTQCALTDGGSYAKAGR